MHINHYVEEANLKGYMLCNSNYMTFCKRKNYGDNKKISNCQWGGEGGTNRQSTEDFQGSETILSDAVTQTHVIILCICSDPWNVPYLLEPSGKLWTREAYVSVQVHQLEQWILLVQDGGGRGGCVCMGQGCMETL